MCRDVEIAGLYSVGVIGLDVLDCGCCKLVCRVLMAWWLSKVRVCQCFCQCFAFSVCVIL